MIYKRVLLATATMFSLGVATPAFANCAEDLELVTAAMETTPLNDNDRAKVDEVKAGAMEKQSAGDEAGCIADLAMAKTILQLN